MAINNRDDNAMFDLDEIRKVDPDVQIFVTNNPNIFPINRRYYDLWLPNNKKIFFLHEGTGGRNYKLYALFDPDDNLLYKLDIEHNVIEVLNLNFYKRNTGEFYVGVFPWGDITYTDVKRVRDAARDAVALHKTEVLTRLESAGKRPGYAKLRKYLKFWKTPKGTIGLAITAFAGLALGLAYLHS